MSSKTKLGKGKAGNQKGRGSSTRPATDEFLAQKPHTLSERRSKERAG